MPQSSASNKDLILGWISRLSSHFNSELSDDQILIYLNALAKNGPGQINAAFERCLNECEFFPKLADVHKRMPDSESTTQSWSFVQPKPLIEVNRPFCVELSPLITGKEYDDLDVVKEAKLIFKVSFAATRLRYERMGVNTFTWKKGNPRKVDVREFLDNLRYPTSLFGMPIPLREPGQEG